MIHVHECMCILRMLVHVCVSSYICVYMRANPWEAPNWLVGNLSISL